jgi:alkanesulfonate monooxygenase SsuD/methylene tetrahydromethanopterin reductase-like flavin-dependent oxidoreductase (luciferase family)
VFQQANRAPRSSRPLPIGITLISILLWAVFVTLSQAFLVFSQPVTGEETEYLRDNLDTFAALLDADLGDDFGRLIHEAASSDDPHSSVEGMEEAAEILEEHTRRQHIIGDRDQREELIRQLKARGIDFDEAFANFETDRQERLDRAFPSARDQSSDGQPANDA